MFEIPSGYLSDRFSRRRVLICGAIVHFLGFITLAAAQGFWQILLGESLLGIATALFSGTLEAYTYDLLKRNNTQKHFLKEFGAISTYGQSAGFIGALISGFLFSNIGGTGILLIEALFCLIAALLFFFTPELSEIRRKKAKNKSDLADAIGITYRTLKNPKLRDLILFPSMFSAFTIILLWILQPVMETTHVPVILFGIYFGINKFSSILFAKYAHKICDKFGEITVSLITIISVILGILLTFMTLSTHNMSFIYIACAIMAIIPSIRILNNLQYNTLIHHDIESKERGTVLSTRAMVSSATGAIMLAIAKVLLDNYGIKITMLFTLFMTIFLFIQLKNITKYIKK
jgi:MFS family permease